MLGWDGWIYLRSLVLKEHRQSDANNHGCICTRLGDIWYQTGNICLQCLSTKKYFFLFMSLADWRFVRLLPIYSILVWINKLEKEWDRPGTLAKKCLLRIIEKQKREAVPSNQSDTAIKNYLGEDSIGVNIFITRVRRSPFMCHVHNQVSIPNFAVLEQEM